MWNLVMGGLISSEDEGEEDEQVRAQPDQQPEIKPNEEPKTPGTGEVISLMTGR